MIKNEKGATLVELLASLVLVTLVVGLIWTAISIATKFNVAETSTLRLQQEANYIIAELQNVHRKCSQYNLVLTENLIEIKDCLNDEGNAISSFNQVISSVYQYSSNIEPSEGGILINSEAGKSPLDTLKITDPNQSNRYVEFPVSISRIKTDKGGG